MRKLNKKKLIIIIGCALLIIGVVAILILINKGSKSAEFNSVKKKKDEPKVQIVDVNSTSRPYAVMINNIKDARSVQSGLNKAYLVYELIVEGGITRYLALFKDVQTIDIGSIRSSRHYYLDYVLENDAIYVHWGWSPQAKEDISSLGINNINGLTYEGVYFYRTNKISAPHNGFTNMEMLKSATEKLKYRTTTDQDLLLDYSATSVDYTTKENVTDANSISIKYSNYITNTYEYDAENKVYKRYINGEEQIDHETETPVTVKNIIAYSVNSYTISGDSKGRQFLENIGTGKGLLISEGKAVNIIWTKKDRESQTVYTYEDGSQIKVNDGNTWIQIYPTDGNLEVA